MPDAWPPHQEVLQQLVVGDDTVVNNCELCVGIAHVRVAVDGTWDAVSGPSRVCNAHVALQEQKGEGHWSEGKDEAGLTIGIRPGVPGPR